MSAISKGLSFEEAVVNKLNGLGLKSHRTIVSNIFDPDGYKRGFDGGIDIITEVIYNKKKKFTFYIQCKNQANNLTKTAISEAYAGTIFRNHKGFPVVISTSDASEETRQFAKDLGVELILPEDDSILQQAKITQQYQARDYGNLMRMILYRYTKDASLLKALRNLRVPFADKKAYNETLKTVASEFNNAQALLDDADKHERLASEARQKSLTIQKSVAYNTIMLRDDIKHLKENRQKPIISAEDD